MISAITWVSKGKLKSAPEKYQITDEDIARLKSGRDESGVGEAELDEAIEKFRNKNKPKEEEEEDPEDMGDEDDEEDMAEPLPNDEYPMAPEEEDDLDEIDDLTIRPTDCIVLGAVARSEDDEETSRLEVHVYEEGGNNLYLHHDIMLSTFPLCMAYMDHGGADRVGNFVAVGGFEPAIEIWDLDVLDVMDPALTLGGILEEAASAKKKPKYKPDSHTGAIMGLSWNTKTRNFLASGSADATVKIWDLNTEQCARTLKHHKKEVQSVEWHPTESSIMVTGSFDKTVQLFDVRANDTSSHLTWDIPHDCECIQWNPQNPQYFAVGTENGTVYYYDVMKGSKSAPVWTINAHSKAASCIAINTLVPLLVTGSVDKTIKLFDIGGAKPKLLESIPWACGVFGIGFYSDVPNLLGVGSESNGVRVLDLSGYDSVVNAFKNNGGAQEEGAQDTMMIENLSIDGKSKDKKKNKKKKNNKRR